MGLSRTVDCLENDLMGVCWCMAKLVNRTPIRVNWYSYIDNCSIHRQTKWTWRSIWICLKTGYPPNGHFWLFDWGKWWSTIKLSIVFSDSRILQMFQSKCFFRKMVRIRFIVVATQPAKITISKITTFMGGYATLPSHGRFMAASGTR